MLLLCPLASVLCDVGLCLYPLPSVQHHCPLHWVLGPLFFWGLCGIVLCVCALLSSYAENYGSVHCDPPCSSFVFDLEYVSCIVALCSDFSGPVHWSFAICSKVRPWSCNVFSVSLGDIALYSATIPSINSWLHGVVFPLCLLDS